jgi:carboxyl-terminal processing protease
VQLAALALLLGGCASVRPAIEPSDTGDPLLREAIERTAELYFYPERLDRRMLVGALDALEGPFDQVRFEDLGEYGELHVVEASARVPLDQPFDPERFQRTLSAALDFAKQKLPPEELEEDQDLELVALAGALGALDRYSTVFSPDTTEDFQIRFTGKLHGIGARIGRRDGQLVAVRVFEGSPAEAAGLRDDDAILEIDGTQARRLSVREAVNQIRGDEGTQVVLRIRRDEEQRELRITRGEVLVPSVEDEDLGDGVGYLRITTVTNATVDELPRKIRELGEVRGLVLDLRGNSGGSMLAAAKVADMFLSTPETIVRVIDRHGDGGGAQQRAVASPRVLFTRPVAVLVDPATASAAEIISGALSPLERVTLIGQTTFGKGLIQRVVPLPEEALLKLTVGEYLLSRDRAIHEKGVPPDIELFPVFSQDLGRLATVPVTALPYLRDAPDHDDDEEEVEPDEFPKQLAKRVLLEGAERAMAAAREETHRAIEEALRPYDVRFVETGFVPEEGETPVTIAGEALDVKGGAKARVRIRVKNTSDRAIPEAWLSLAGGLEFLRNQNLPLGTLEPREERSVELELEAPDGLAAEELPVFAQVASGTRPLAQSELVLRVGSHAPVLRIEIVRLDPERVRVAVRNQGCCHPGALHVAVPGTIENIEALAPGEERAIELSLSDDVEAITLLVEGTGARQRLEIPLPPERVEVVPPELRVERVTWLGRTQIRVVAQSDQGLREGWLALDGQKQAYVAFGGARDGTLRVGLERGAHDVTTKVETLSGVSLIDSRRVTGD